MAAFKAEVQNKRADGTYIVRIRVIRNRVTRRIPTTIYVTDDDLTRGLKIKNVKIINKCDRLIMRCREYCADLGFKINTYSADEVADLIKKHLEGGERFRLNFISYTEEKAAEMKKKHGRHVSKYR